MLLDLIVIFPGNAETRRVTSVGSESVSIREARCFDRFAEELGRCTSARVEIDDSLRLPPVAEGVFYICRPDVIDRSIAAEPGTSHLLASRTTVVDMVRTYALRQAEELGLAAVIESGEYAAWQESKNLRPAAFYGLKTVGKVLGASWQRIPIWEGPNYALLRHSSLQSLPAFLAAYLEAYASLL